MFIHRRFEFKSKLRKTCTKPSSHFISTCPPLPQTVRIIKKEDINNAVKVFYAVLGKGVFGKCLHTKLGPHEVCVKVFNNADNSSSCHFYNEVCMLSELCHPQLPWLYGINDGAVKITVLSCISFCGGSLNLHEALYNSNKGGDTLTDVSLKGILADIASALVYLAKCSIIHNDIKCDNIMIESIDKSGGISKGFLIDFGKSCFLKNGRRYSLSTSVQKEYSVRHPQIPPDVVCGTNAQSHASDIYAFGRVIGIVNKKRLNIPLLQSLSTLCMKYDVPERPTIHNIFTSFTNLL